MKRCKILFSFIVVVLMFFIYNVKINAYEQTTGEIKVGNMLYFDGTNVTTTPNEIYPRFFYKYSDTTGAYNCASGLLIKTPRGINCTYSASHTSSYKPLGVAYILNYISGVNGGKRNPTNEEYYWMEVAAMYYLGTYTSASESFAYMYPNVISNPNFKILNTNSSFQDILNAADAYQAKYSKNLEIALSESSLNFTLNSDGNYYSQKVYISDINQNADNISVTIDNNNFTKIEGNDAGGRYFQIKIEKSKVVGNKLDVNVSINASNTFYKANVYYCSSEEYQQLIQSATDQQQNFDSKSISGSVSSTKLVIKKVDKNGNLLAGAKIKVECPSNNYSEIFESSDTELVLEDLPYCEYKIKEVSAPSKYVKDTNEYSATLSETNLSSIITISNGLTRVEISKTNIATGDLLPGALLQVKDKNGNILYQWESTNEAYVIEGLEAGTYYLVEISSPEGYDLNEEQVEFVVNDELEVVKVEMVNVLHVDVPDTLSSRSVFMMCMAMFVISLGIGTLVYVKTNKLNKA